MNIVYVIEYHQMHQYHLPLEAEPVNNLAAITISLIPKYTSI